MIYLKITSIKPVLDDDGPDGPAKAELGVSRFFYSVPFTTKASRIVAARQAWVWSCLCCADGSSLWQGSAHGSTGEQFKRTTELVVAHPFPYCTSRQVGSGRVSPCPFFEL